MTKSKSNLVTVPTSAIVADVSAQFEQIPKKMTKEVISTFLGIIEDSIIGGHKVRIDKVGILICKDRAARRGRNPQTGEEIKIPASKKISFRVAKSLKEKVGIHKKLATTKRK